jgi:two-component system, NtrC family, sensor kinase
VYLARKLSLVFVLLGAVVLTGQILFELEHEIQSTREDERADHRLLGRALAGSVTAAWQREGKEAALELLERSNRFQDVVFVRWVWIDAAPGEARPRVAVSQLDALSGAGYLSFELKEGHQPILVSYVPFQTPLGRRGAIEITEPIPGRAQVALRAVRSVAISSALLGALFVIATVVIGRRLIGKPVQALVQMAQQVEIGNLKARTFLNRHDELGLLSVELNNMASGLEYANARIASETAAKIEAQESVRHADRLTTVGKLAAGVAHELGTPLNVVDGRARMIASSQLEPAAIARSARIISEQVTAMTRIIRQLLDFARRRAPERTIEPLQPLVAQVLELLRPLALKHQVTLAPHVPEQLKLSIDAAAIGQVMTNLVVNAIQAMERPGEVRVRATEEVRAPPPHMGGPSRAWVRIDVEDSGPGIRPEIRAHIFEPFFTTKGVGEGTGLGLSVSYGIIQDHGGWITVDPALPPAPGSASICRREEWGRSRSRFRSAPVQPERRPQAVVEGPWDARGVGDRALDGRTSTTAFGLRSV